MKQKAITIILTLIAVLSSLLIMPEKYYTNYNILKLIKYRQEIENKSTVISNEEISENDYNIAVNSYLKTITEDIQMDIEVVNKKILQVL